MFGRDALRIVRRRVCRSMTQLRPTCDKFGIEMNRVAKMGALELRRDRDKKHTASRVRTNSALSMVICWRSTSGLGATSGLTDLARGMVALMCRIMWMNKKKVGNQKLGGGKEEGSVGGWDGIARERKTIKRDFAWGLTVHSPALTNICLNPVPFQPFPHPCPFCQCVTLFV